MRGQTLDVFSETTGYANATNIGGSRYPLWVGQAFNPNNYVGTTTPVPLGLLSVPPTYDQIAPTGAGMSQGASNALASQFPWSPGKSPTPLIIVGLIVSVIGLHFLYFKRKK